MSEEIKSLKNYISTTKNEIFTTFKIETISNLIIYYEDLQQKVEQLEKENISLKEANNYHQEVIKSMKEPENAHHYHLENIKLRAINNQLENIRKEAIEEIQRVLDIWTNKPNEIATLDLEHLLNILNKGSNKE